MENFINNAPFIVVLLSLIVGFVFLVKGADLFVEGSSSVAKRFKVPSLIIGLTIVAMGTSLPETAVSVAASIAHNNTLAVSNVTGSNIFNLMVVIGVCALMTPVVVDGASLKRDFPFSMICAILLLVMGTIGMTLGRVDGIILLGCFAGYIFYLIRHTLKQNRQSSDEGVDEIPLISMPKAVIFILIGAVGIAVGGDVVVDSASRIAIDLGMSRDTRRTDHRIYRNIASGACDINSRSRKKRGRYGTRKCSRLMHFQHTHGARNCISHQPDSIHTGKYHRYYRACGIFTHRVDYGMDKA